MKAAILTAPGSPLEVVDDVELDDPRPGEVEVRITHVGVCHSDHLYASGVLPADYPLVLGHEVTGIVERLGAGVTEVAEGDRVVLTNRPPCGSCYWCSRGESQLCARSEQLLGGTYPDGGTRLSRLGRPVYRGIVLAGFAERTVVPASAAVPVPDDVDPAVAAIVGCAVVTGVGAVLNTAKVQPGDTVAAVGLGGVGMAIVQGARCAGATRIIAVDVSAERREFALRLGATDVVDPGEVKTHHAVRDLTAGIGVDHGFDAVGRVGIIADLSNAIRRGGQVVLVGLPKADERLSVNALGVNLYEKKIIGCYLGSSHARRDFPRLLELNRAGHLDLRALVTTERPLDEINQAMDDLTRASGIRTVLHTE